MPSPTIVPVHLTLGRPARALLPPCLGVAGLAVLAATGAHAWLRLVGPEHLPVASMLSVAVASGLFIASGALRLSRWRLVDDRHSAIVGIALLVMGGMCLPLDGFTRLLVTPEDAALAAVAGRCVLSCVAMTLLLRSAPAPGSATTDTQARALVVIGGVLAMTTALVGPGPLRLDHAPAQVAPTMVLSATLVGGWWWVAWRVATVRLHTQWGRRSVPLFVGMGLAEALRGLDLGQMQAWTASGVLVCATMAALSTRSSLLDLDDAVQQHRSTRTGLALALGEASGQAEQLVVWRERVTHDARNAFVGLRAAMDILERFEGRVDAATATRLRQAAVSEIKHLEHLLTHTEPEPCRDVEVLGLVRELGHAASALGTPVTVTGRPAFALGRPGDIEVVLKNLLANARAHATGSAVHLEVTTSGQRVVVTCSDGGPGIAPDVQGRVFERGVHRPGSPGSGLGLHAARELVRQQGGDLVVASSDAGATFSMLLPRHPTLRARPAAAPRVPRQRVQDPHLARVTA